MRNRKHIVAVSVLIVVGSVLLYFGLKALYPLPPAASGEADTIDFMFDVYFALIAFMFSLIMVFMLYAVAVFRRKPGDTEDAAHIHGNTTLEIVWTILPLALVIFLGVWGATTLNDLIKERSDEMVVRVIGKQWAWSFEYPEQGDLGSPDLVLPVNQNILLKMQSEDVLHSFWVPEFRVKQDLLPGRDTTLRIQPTEIGEYKLLCAEICGFSHTAMRANVSVVSQADFDAWIEERSALPVYGEMTAEERGAIWASADGGYACTSCHSLDGTPGAGPTWLGLLGRQEALADGTTIVVDEEYIANSILNPNAQIVEGFNANVMPQIYADSFAAKEAEILANEGIEISIIDDLIAFISTLEE